MKKPLIIELDEAPLSPSDAPPVGEIPDERYADAAAAQGRAMQIAARIAARPSSRVGRFFWTVAGILFGFVVSVASWRFVEGLFASNPALGWVATVLFVLFAIAALTVAGREVAAFSRLGRLDAVQREVNEALLADDLTRARAVSGKLASLYAGRPELAWGHQRFTERAPEQIDTQTLLTLAETEFMTPLDAAARLEVEAAVRTVATVTALVPLALADVIAAMTANLRMIRRIGEIYGGRSGTLGSIRLAKTVMTHLVATGAVAAGDDLIETVTGGHIFAKLSRRFGEGVVNGALTARVGVAAMEVCRPMPFRSLERPRVTRLTGRALAGVFTTKKADDPDGPVS